MDDSILLCDIKATEVARVVIKEAKAWAAYTGVGMMDDPLVIDGVIAMEGGRITREFVDRFRGTTA